MSSSISTSLIIQLIADEIDANTTEILSKRDKSQAYRTDENTVHGGVIRINKDYTRIQA